MNPKTSFNPPARPIRWGLVGTGTIASHYADDMQYAHNAMLAGVCSRTQQAATAFAGRYAIGKTFTDIGAMAASPDIDAVIVASVNTAHFEQAKTLLQAGKHVLVEKPIVMSSKQAHALAVCAAENGVFAMEALWTAFLPAIDRVRDMLSENAIGPVRGIRAELAFEKPYEQDSRFFAPELGGGSLMDLGVYAIALTRALFGAPVAIDGQWRAAPSGVDMAAEITLDYSSFEARLACGFDRNGENRFIIEGETGSIVIGAPFLNAPVVFLTRNKPAEQLVRRLGSGRLQHLVGTLARTMPVPGLRASPGAIKGYGLQFEIEAASAAILAGRMEEERMPLAASIDALSIIETIRSKPPVPVGRHASAGR